jgi:hypothetical protein
LIITKKRDESTVEITLRELCVMDIEHDEEDADSIEKAESKNLSVELFGFLLEDLTLSKN